MEYKWTSCAWWLRQVSEQSSKHDFIGIMDYCLLLCASIWMSLSILVLYYEYGVVTLNGSNQILHNVVVCLRVFDTLMNLFSIEMHRMSEWVQHKKHIIIIIICAFVFAVACVFLLRLSPNSILYFLIFLHRIQH